MEWISVCNRNLNLTAVTKDPTQDTGVLGSLVRFHFFKPPLLETGIIQALGVRAKDAAAQLP
ncbi:hypothetical protein ACEQPO_13420 [Bacillus sp. SL00103]